MMKDKQHLELKKSIEWFKQECQIYSNQLLQKNKEILKQKAQIDGLKSDVQFLET